MSNRDALKWLGRVTTTTRLIAQEIADHLEKEGLDLPRYGSPQNGPVMWGYNPDGAEHGTGRAIDVMVKAPGAVGEAVAEFVWANRDRYDLTHMIWRQRIRSTVVSPGVWRPQGDRGNPTANHMDHLHILFGKNPKLTGAAKAPAAKPAPAKKPTPKPTAPAFPLPRGHWYGVESRDRRNHSGYHAKDRPGIKQWQAQMKKRGWRIRVDGYFGPASEKVARQFQAEKGIRVDGAVGAQTWAAAWSEPVT